MTYTLLLDTSSLMYRAFFALPQTIATGDGEPVNAVHGYLDMTARLLREYAPDELIHVYDADWRPAARADVYPPYKADRPDEPETLTPQFAWLPQMLDTLGMAQAQAPGWEADDAIGSLCAAGAPGDASTSSPATATCSNSCRTADDGCPTVRLLFTVRGVSNLDGVRCGRGRRPSYGVPPQRYVDFATLRGDPSDGLPGVAGIGEKTAARLVNQYASLDDLRRPRRCTLTPRLAANLLDAGDYLAAMQNGRAHPPRCDGRSIASGRRPESPSAAWRTNWAWADRPSGWARPCAEQ